MLDKIKKVLATILICIVVFSAIYCFVTLVSSMMEKPSLLNSNNLEEYIANENIVHDYRVFYYIDNCINNIIEGCKKNKYVEIYDIYIEEYKVQLSKDEINLKLKNFSLDDVKYKLNYVYKVEDLYLANVTINEEEQYIIIKLNSTKESNYCFAFFK